MFEYAENVKTFEDLDIISLESIESKNFKTVNDEIERGQRLSEERNYWKKEKRPEFPPLFEKHLKNSKDNKRIVYRQIIDRMKPIYPEVCRHIGNFTVNRSIMTRNEHVNFLSFPKCAKYPPREEYVKIYYKKILLPNSTARIEKLATPNLRLMENTLKKFSQYLSARQLENLTHFITGRHYEKITTVDRALALMQEEKYQKELIHRKLKREIEAEQKNIESKRLKQVEQIVLSLYEVMKNFLMAKNDTNLKSEMRLLSNFIVHNIAEFSGYDIPSCKSQEFIDKFIIDLGDNLSIWMEKLTTTFGFTPLVKEGLLPQRKSITKNEKYSTEYGLHQNRDTDLSNKSITKTINDFRDENGALYLPIDDYISLSESFSGFEEISKVHQDDINSPGNENK